MSKFEKFISFFRGKKKKGGSLNKNKEKVPKITLPVTNLFRTSAVESSKDLIFEQKANMMTQERSCATLPMPQSEGRHLKRLSLDSRKLFLSKSPRRRKISFMSRKTDRESCPDLTSNYTDDNKTSLDRVDRRTSTPFKNRSLNGSTTSLIDIHFDY